MDSCVAVPREKRGQTARWCPGSVEVAYPLAGVALLVEPSCTRHENPGTARYRGVQQRVLEDDIRSMWKSKGGDVPQQVDSRACARSLVLYMA